MKHHAILLPALALLPAFAFAAPTISTLNDQKSVEVTVYNSNIGLVKDTRRISLPSSGELRFMDVASGIMPQTVHATALTPNGISVLEQNYEYDLMEPSKLLDKYVGKRIKLLKTNDYTGTKESVDAVLLSNNNGPIYKINNEIYLGAPGLQVLPEIPENLVAKPTLTWMFDSKAQGPQDVEVSYLTNGINWHADYVLVVDKDDKLADLSGWVTLDNQSGAEYRDAKLKLVAGQVNRAQPKNMYQLEMAARASDSASQFQESSFFEYHIYDMQRPTTIKDRQSKQVSLLEAKGVGVGKEYAMANNREDYWYAAFGGQELKVPVEVRVKFKNAAANHLGMPLPAGVIRLYKEDTNGALQFAGEDNVEHTPKDEEVSLKVGEAFDVVAERLQTDFKNVGFNDFESEWQVTLRNHKDSDINVSITELLPLGWTVINSSHPYVKVSATSIKFNVAVPKNGETKVKYRIRVQR